MAKSSKKTQTTESSPMSATVDIMAAFNPMRETALKAWFDMGLEALRFVSSRMQEDIETQRAMLACKSPEDIRKVQADFYTKALEDYHAEASRMMEIIKETTADELGEGLPSTKRGYDDVPL